MSQSKKNWNASKAQRRSTIATKKKVKVMNAERKEAARRVVKGMSQSK